MKLKNNLGLRGFPKRSMISFYNGSEIEIEIEEFEAFWELLSLLKDQGFVQDSLPLSSWKNKYGKTEQDLTDIKQNLEMLGMLYEPSNINEALNRNYNFFSTYDKSPKSTEIMSKVSNLKILIIGCGTLGSSIAQTLAKIGVGTLVLTDFDTVEAKNIVAQYTFTKNDIGKKKTDVIEKSIGDSSYNTKVFSYDIQIDNIDEISKIVEKHKIDYVINSFDLSSKELDTELLNYTSQAKVNYILTGYLRDITFVYKLDKDTGTQIIQESYSDFDASYVISNNRGTILNALIGSQLVANLITLEQIDNDYRKSRKISYNLKDMKLENTVLEPEQKFSRENFIDTLNKIYSTVSLKKNIKKIAEMIEKHDLELALSTVEEDILNIHQFFDLLIETDLLEATSNEDTYELFTDLMKKVDQDDAEKNYLKYINIIDEIDSDRKIKNYSNIYTELMNLNLNHNYTEKYTIQKSTYESIFKRAEDLIEIISQQKMEGLSLDQEVYDREVIGLNSIDLNNFEAIMEEKYPKAVKDLYSEFVNLENGETVDYLEDKIPEETYFGDFDKAIDTIKSTFKNNTQFFPLVYHLDKLVDENRIFISDLSSHNNINKTVFFSNKREGVIVLAYDNTYDALLTAVHEIGHYYYNNLYAGPSFTDKSNRLINEILAHYFQYEFMLEFLNSPDFDEKTKEHLKTRFIERFSKGLLSNFSIRLLEKKFIKQLEKGPLTVSDFLKIRKECDADIEDYIKFKNSDLYYLNLLIYPYFGFNYKDYVSDSLAVITAVSLGNCHLNPLERKDTLQKFLSGDNFEISNFYSVFFKNNFSDIIGSQTEEFITSLKRL